MKLTPSAFAALSLVTLIAPTLSFGADATTPPPDLCAGGAECTPLMIAILKQFDSLATAPAADRMPAVYSGACGFLDYGTDPTVVQYAVTLLEEKNTHPQFSALLTFFSDGNPYQGLTVAQAEKQLAAGGSSLTPMLLGDTFDEVDFLTPTTQIRYWLRQDPATHEVIMISQFLAQGSNVEPRTFCRLIPNA